MPNITNTAIFVVIGNVAGQFTGEYFGGGDYLLALRHSIIASLAIFGYWASLKFFYR